MAPTRKRDDSIDTVRRNGIPLLTRIVRFQVLRILEKHCEGLANCGDTYSQEIEAGRSASFAINGSKQVDE